jgi:hypothetical protein
MDHLTICQCLVSSFFAVLFIQSGLDKVVDRAGNLEYLKGHFKATPLLPVIPLCLAALTLLEVAAGVVCAVGFVVLLTGGSSAISYLGTFLCSVTFVSLFTGQRIAKDYAGAASLVPYFTLSLVAMYVCNPAQGK